MIHDKFIGFIATCCACFVASSLTAATIPAGTVLDVKTASSISSQDPAGRTFAAQLDQDVAVKGQILLKAKTQAFGKIKSSRANPRRSEPLTLELTSISVGGHSRLHREARCNSNWRKRSRFRLKDQASPRAEGERSSGPISGRLQEH